MILRFLSANLRGEALPWLIALVGIMILFGPAMKGLVTSSLGDDAQGHSVIIVGICAWMAWQRSRAVLDQPLQPKVFPGWIVFGVGCVFFALGKFFNVIQFELGALIPVAAGVLLLLRGPASLKILVFPLLFFAFAIPLPRAVADGLTQPMKEAVSYVAESIMYAAGYPVARQGVVLSVGQYQLLVADACAGLYTLFTLEALGLMYLNLVKSASVVRNAVMAVMVVPISLAANITRVIVLCLVTYYFGDEAGQGFIHGFAGMVLFLSALMLTVGLDSMVRAGLAMARRTRGVAV